MPDRHVTCGSAYYRARKFGEYEHTVKLVVPQFVKPYVKDGLERRDRCGSSGSIEQVACSEKTGMSQEDPGAVADGGFCLELQAGPFNPLDSRSVG